MKKVIYSWGPVIIWAGLIFTASSIPTLPNLEIIWWDFVLKKTAHVTEYAIFYFLLVRAQNTSFKLFPPKINLKTWSIAFFLAIIYAASDEFHQSFVPGRTPKVTDVGFDTLGMLISQTIIKRRHKPSTSPNKADLVK